MLFLDIKELKKHNLFLIKSLCVATFLMSCTASTATSNIDCEALTLDSVISNPEKYNGKIVCLDGYWVLAVPKMGSSSFRMAD